MKEFKNRFEKLQSLSAEFLQSVCDQSNNLHEVAEKIFKTRSMSRHVSIRMKELDVDTSGLRGRAQKRTRDALVKLGATKKAQARVYFEEFIAPELFKESSVYDGKRARRLISHWNRVFAWFDYCCELCGNTGVHNGKKLVLQIDHKNGDSRDHRFENIRYLCPNCHSQTETFTGKNTKTQKQKRTPSG